MLSRRRLMLSSLIVCGLVIASACTKGSPANSNNNQANNNPAASSNPVPAPAVRSEPTIKPPKPGKGNIQITSTPSGAGVTLVPSDDSGASLPQAYGQTPTTIADLAPGTYTVQMALTGHKTFTKDVKVTANSTVKINAALQK
jgi:hypothetical protein